MLVYQTKPLGIQLHFHANFSFCGVKLTCPRVTWVKTLYWVDGYADHFEEACWTNCVFQSEFTCERKSDKVRYSVIILFVALRLEYGNGNNDLKSRFSDAKLVSVMSRFSPRKEKEKTFLSKVFFFRNGFWTNRNVSRRYSSRVGDKLQTMNLIVTFDSLRIYHQMLNFLYFSSSWPASISFRYLWWQVFYCIFSCRKYNNMVGS